MSLKYDVIYMCQNVQKNDFIEGQSMHFVANTHWISCIGIQMSEM